MKMICEVEFTEGEHRHSVSGCIVFDGERWQLDGRFSLIKYTDDTIIDWDYFRAWSPKNGEEDERKLEGMNIANAIAQFAFVAIGPEIADCPRPSLEGFL